LPFLFPTTTPSAAIYQGSANITNQTQTVVVGQQIPLVGVTNLPGAFTQAWSVSGASSGQYVGGYYAQASQGCLVDQNAASASNPNGCVQGTGLGLIMDAQTLTIYFTQVPAGPVTVTYALYGQGASPVAMATTTFNVVGPGGTSLAVTSLQGVGIIPPNPPNGWLLGLGNVHSQPGIVFQGTATAPNSYAGNFVWVQLTTVMLSDLKNDGSGHYVCMGGPGLDTIYPYPSAPTQIVSSTSDSPDLGLSSSSYTTQYIEDDFVMFLMWQPSQANSIPVPIGYVRWGWQGLADWESNTNTWVALVAPTPYSAVIQPATLYPTWSTRVVGGGLECSDQP
jgi:hypothetical protein